MAKGKRNAGRLETVSRKNRSAMILIAVVVFVLTIVLFVSGNLMQKEIAENETRQAQLTEEMQAEQARTKSIESYGEYMQTDEYIREAAKDQLGLVDENDTVFINEGG
ncbi:MAG: FtsB family cell division protein [Lachnospiraceae bacterium]